MLTTTRRLIRTLLLLIAIGAALSIVAATRAAAPDLIVALSCPRGQVVWLEGEGQPYSAALVVFNGRTVGGGSVPASGRWRIPLRAEEARGVYPVSVVDRATRAVLASYLCYVDLPLPGGDAAAVSAAPPMAATAIPPTATALLPTAAPSLPTATSVRPTATRAATATRTVPTATATATASAPTATTPPATVAPETLVTPSSTPIAGVANVLRFYEALGGDPSTINTDTPVYGYISIKNSGSAPISLTGWKLVNSSAASRPVFTFPSYTLAAGAAVVIVPDEGTSSEEMLFWGINQIAWESGHRVVLRTPQGEDVIGITVP